MKANRTIRTARIETDIPGVTRLMNFFEDQPVSEDDVRSWFEAYCPPEYHTLRLIAEDESGRITGYSRMIHDLSAPEHHFRVWMCVDPALQRQGIGSALWEASLDYLRQQGATRLSSEVSDQDPAALGFAQRRGFNLNHHMFHSTLDLATFDETPYLPGIAALEAQGIRFCSLADFPDTPENRYKLYDLNETVCLDNPNSDGTRTIYPEFEKFIFNAPWFRREGQILAVNDDTFIGLCAVSLNAENQSAYNENTGVLRAYRGRKIAQALKVLAARYASQQGARQIGTHNDSRNEPILAINRKLGYQPQPGTYLLVGWLKED